MRFELIQPETIQMRESAGLVKDIYDPVSTIRQPLSEYRTMLDLIHNDTTLATAYDIIVDFATHRGGDFIGGTKQKRDILRNKFEELNVKQVLPNHLYQGCYYGDAFLEFRKQNSKTVNELWPLETTEMRIQYDIHGKVEGYWQRPFSMSGLTDEEITEEEGTPNNPNKGIFFEPDEVMHTRMKWIGSQVYSYNPNTPISTPAATNLYAGNYLMNIFINMPPRYVAHLAGVGKSEYASAKKEFQASKTNYKKTIAFSRSNDPQSKLDIQKIEPPYDTELIGIMRYLQNEILKVTRVPRSWLAESANENRGVTEAEQRPFDVRIQAIHNNILEPDINRKLLPATGHSKKGKEAKSFVRYKFNEISKKGEKEILENTRVLKEMGLKPEAVVRYLDERGILGLDPTDFEEPELMGALPKDKDSFPSRAKMDKSTQDMTQNRNERGVSDASGKKMGIQS